MKVHAAVEIQVKACLSVRVIKVSVTRERITRYLISISRAKKTIEVKSTRRVELGKSRHI